MNNSRLINRVFAWTALLIILSTHHAIASSYETIKGSACYKYGDNETPLIAKDMALELAKRRAIETYKVYVSSTTEIVNLKLESDIINSLTGAYLYGLKITKESELGREVCVWIEAKVKPDEVNKLIADKISSVSHSVSKSNSSERIGDGEIDWNRMIIWVKGFGGANKTFPKHVWRKSAEEAAIVDAQTKLIEIINGLKIHSKTFVRNYQISLDEKVKEIKGRLQNVRKAGATNYPTEDTAEVIMELDIE